MPTAIQIKRSTGDGAPAASDLIEGELAYAEDRSNNGASAKLYISSINSSSAEVIQIVGGKYYTDIVDGATNANTANKLVKRDGSGNFSAGAITAGSLDISGDTDIDGTLEADAITVNGTALAEVISDTVGAMVGSNTETGITVTYQDADNTLDFAVGTLNQNTTGNAATATALETSRTIGGTSFNGTADIAVALSATATALETARTIGGTSFDGTGNIAVALSTEATNVTVTANNSANETVYPLFVDGVSGTQGAETDSGLNYNPSKGLLSTVGLTASGTVQWGSLSDGAITITAFVDEDNMSSNSATLIPTQQSVKAYVDSSTGGSITVQEEGSSLSTGANTLNFVGSGITATGSGATKTITVSAASVDDATALAIALG